MAFLKITAALTINTDHIISIKEYGRTDRAWYLLILSNGEEVEVGEELYKEITTPAIQEDPEAKNG